MGGNKNASNKKPIAHGVRNKPLLVDSDGDIWIVSPMQFNPIIESSSSLKTKVSTWKNKIRAKEKNQAKDKLNFNCSAKVQRKEKNSGLNAENKEKFQYDTNGIYKWFDSSGKEWHLIQNSGVCSNSGYCGERELYPIDKWRWQDQYGNIWSLVNDSNRLPSTADIANNNAFLSFFNKSRKKVQSCNTDKCPFCDELPCSCQSQIRSKQQNLQVVDQNGILWVQKNLSCLPNAPDRNGQAYAQLYAQGSAPINFSAPRAIPAQPLLTRVSPNKVGHNSNVSNHTPNQYMLSARGNLWRDTCGSLWRPAGKIANPELKNFKHIETQVSDFDNPKCSNQNHILNLKSFYSPLTDYASKLGLALKNFGSTFSKMSNNGKTDTQYAPQCNIQSNPLVEQPYYDGPVLKPLSNTITPVSVSYPQIQDNSFSHVQLYAPAHPGVQQSCQNTVLKSQGCIVPPFIHQNSPVHLN